MDAHRKDMLEQGFGSWGEAQEDSIAEFKQHFKDMGYCSGGSQQVKGYGVLGLSFGCIGHY